MIKINHNISPANSLFMKANSKTSSDKYSEKVEAQKQQSLEKIDRYIASCTKKNAETTVNPENPENPEVIEAELPELEQEQFDPLYQLTDKEREYVTKLREKAVRTAMVMLDARTQQIQNERNAKIDAENRKQKENCDKIYASMSRGDKVPLKDRQFLMKTAPALYSMAMLSAMLEEKEGEKVDSVLTDEEKNTPEEEAEFQAQLDALYADENGDGYLDSTHNLEYIMQLNDILDGKLPYSSLKEGTSKTVSTNSSNTEANPVASTRSKTSTSTSQNSKSPVNSASGSTQTL